ncbi:UNVERIFIED_ORG: hypothetical protein BTE55_30000 [Rhizobium sophorae]
MAGNAAATAQHVAGDGQFVGWSAVVSGGVVEDEVFEMNQFAVDPEGGAGISKMGAFEEAVTDRRTGDALIEPHQNRGRVGNRLLQ